MPINLISIVVPVYNSQGSLRELCQRIFQTFISMPEEIEIILVDDGSKDRSWAVLEKLRAEDERIKIIKLDGNFGQHNATFCGFHYCKGEYIVTLDDDLQHPPEEIPRLLQEMKEGQYDVLFGVPEQKAHAAYKNLGSQLMQVSLNLIFSKPRELQSSSFRILCKEIVNKMMAQSWPNIYIAAQIFSQTTNVSSLPVRHDSRKYGNSNYTLKRSVKLANMLLFNYSLIPLWVLLLASQTTLLLAILYQGLRLGGSKSEFGAIVIPILFFCTWLILSLFSWRLMSIYGRQKKQRCKPTSFFEIEKMIL